MGKCIIRFILIEKLDIQNMNFNTVIIGGSESLQQSCGLLDLCKARGHAIIYSNNERSPSIAVESSVCRRHVVFP